MGTEVLWKEWNWPSRGRIHAWRRNRCTFMASGPAIRAVLMVAGWTVKKETLIEIFTPFYLVFSLTP